MSLSERSRILCILHSLVSLSERAGNVYIAGPYVSKKGQGHCVYCRAVAIPEMMAACEDRNRIDKRLARFVIPFSVTISCNGSALYISGATVFIANLTGTPLNFADVLLIW